MSRQFFRIRVFGFLLIIVHVFIADSFAQQSGTDSLKRLYSEKALWLHESYYIKNNTRYPMALLEKELFPSPVAYIQFKEGIGKYRWGRALTILGTVANIGALVIRNKEAGLSNGLAYSGVGLNLLGLYWGNRGRLKIERAVFNFNQDLLFSPYFRH